MITSLITAFLELLRNLTGIKLQREKRAADPVQVARQEAQQETTAHDKIEANIEKAGKGDQAALDELRRAAAE